MKMLPSRARVVAQRHPTVWQAFEKLGGACAAAGPLDARTRRLVKLALAAGRGSEGAVHSHARQGLAEGLSAEELRHVAILGMPTLGFPAGVAALSWIDDVVMKAPRTKAKRR